MKKSIVILFLLALSFAGSAQQKAAVESRSYYFDVREDFMRAIIKPSGLQWYHEMDLYIDGQFKQTMRIGNRIDMLITHSFSVPVGSSWRLVPGKTDAWKDYSQMMLYVSYNSSGQAEAPGMEAIIVYIR